MFVLSEDGTRTRGSDAQRSNVAVGRAIAEAVRTTLGPRGTDRLLVDASGIVVVDGDAATVADPLEHGIVDPAAVTTEAITAATGAATTIRRIDDVIAAN